MINNINCKDTIKFLEYLSEKYPEDEMIKTYYNRFFNELKFETKLSSLKHDISNPDKFIITKYINGNISNLILSDFIINKSEPEDSPVDVFNNFVKLYKDKFTKILSQINWERRKTSKCILGKYSPFYGKYESLCPYKHKSEMIEIMPIIK